MAKPTGEIGTSLRFKYGTQTIFVFADPTTAFSQISEDLLDVLRDRFPSGLAVSESLPDRTLIPAKGDTYKVSFAVLKSTNEPAKGWRPLNLSGKETPASLKLKNNTALAFAIQTEGEMEEEPTFAVEIPQMEEEEL